MSESWADDPDQAGVPLPGGDVTEGVIRVGSTVRRPVGPHSPLVHALLAHLESVGFTGAPRFLGMDGSGREVLSYTMARWPGGHAHPGSPTRPGWPRSGGWSVPTTTRPPRSARLQICCPAQRRPGSRASRPVPGIRPN